MVSSFKCLGFCYVEKRGIVFLRLPVRGTSPLDLTYLTDGTRDGSRVDSEASPCFMSVRMATEYYLLVEKELNQKLHFLFSSLSGNGWHRSDGNSLLPFTDLAASLNNGVRE